MTRFFPVLLLLLLSACSSAAWLSERQYGREESRASRTAVVSDPRLDEARTEPDPERRAALLAALAGDGNVAVARAARVDLVRLLARLGRVEEMERAAKELEIGDDLEGAETLDAMSRAISDHGKDRDRALSLARRAVDIVETIRLAGPAKGRAKASWKRDLAVRKARHADTVGWALVKGGDLDAGIEQIEKSAKTLPDDVRIQWHLGSARAAAGQREEALAALASAVAGEDVDSARARDALRALAPEEADARIAVATTALAVHVAERATKTRLDDPAPKLTSVKVEPGKPVVVFFWASWDEASLRALESLTALARNPAVEGRVRIASVSLDRAANGTAAAERIGVPFPVGLDPRAVDAAAWRVRALPASVVLDAGGRVRYRNEGMASGYQWVLKAQVESLLGDGT